MSKRFLIQTRNDLRERFYGNVIILFFKWITTIIFVSLIFTNKLVSLIKDTNFFIASLILMLLAACGYAWYVDISLFKKRRRRNKRLLTDPLIIEFIIVLVIILLIGWYYPNFFQGVLSDIKEETNKEEVEGYTEIELQAMVLEWNKNKPSVEEAYDCIEQHHTKGFTETMKICDIMAFWKIEKQDFVWGDMYYYGEEMNYLVFSRGRGKELLGVPNLVKDGKETVFEIEPMPEMGLGK